MGNNTKITNIKYSEIQECTIENGPYNDMSKKYRRLGKYKWEIRIDNQWEQPHGYERELEEAYRKFIQTSNQN